jgi:hypothetical protein
MTMTDSYPPQSTTPVFHTTEHPPERLTFEGPKGPLFKALAEARKHYLSLTADSSADVQLKGGGGYKHSYADLDTVIKALTPGWIAAGLAVMQFIDGDDVTTLVAFEESSVSIRCPVPGYDTPQQMGSGTTYIRRYQLKAVFCVNDSEDDDGNAAQGNKASISRKEPSASKPQLRVSPALAASVTAAAKANEMPGAEFFALVKKQTGKAWVDCDDTDAQKVLAILEGK